MTAILTRVSKNISAEQNRAIRDASVYIIGVQTTTASYVDLDGSVIDTANATSIAYIVKNTHATLTIKYKIMGSIDNVTYVEVQSEASLAAVSGVGSYSAVNPVYRYYKIQVIDNSGHGTASAHAIIKD